MARLGVDYELVKLAAIKLLSQGTAPSVQKIREVLGTGSNTTIAEHLKVWRDEYAKKTTHYLPANMPKELISTFEVLWQTAMEHAQNQLAEYKLTLDGEREITLQIQHDAEKTIANIKQQLIEAAAKLEQEIGNKQKLNVELGIANNRLAKQDEVLVTQKNQYEDRLKRIYEDKDVVMTQNQQLQKEIHILQGRITLQTENHQNMLAQQNALHEQSENRWLKLIDQARQETKEVNKKHEYFKQEADEKIKKLNAASSELQKYLYENKAELNVSIEQVNELKQKLISLEKENISLRSIVMKFEEEQKMRHHEISIKKTLTKKDLKLKQELSVNHDSV